MSRLIVGYGLMKALVSIESKENCRVASCSAAAGRAAEVAKRIRRNEEVYSNNVIVHSEGRNLRL